MFDKINQFEYRAHIKILYVSGHHKDWRRLITFHQTHESRHLIHKAWIEDQLFYNSDHSPLINDQEIFIFFEEDRANVGYFFITKVFHKQEEYLAAQKDTSR